MQDEILTGYPISPPFSPILSFPEYPFHTCTLAPKVSSLEGRVYNLVRSLFTHLRLDIEHFGTQKWNPLGKMIQPGDTVLIKPNLVRNYHGTGGDVYSLITHGSLVRSVLDYVYIALRNQGQIIIGDAPLQTTNFAKVVQLGGVEDVVDFYTSQGVDIDLVDFRQYKSSFSVNGLLKGNNIGGDPRGSTVIDLTNKSRLLPLSSSYERFRVTNYNPSEMHKHHNLKTNEYLIANSLLKADVVINLPKMKTHHKVGITAALKNLVGINAHKDWLPHHLRGSISEGGDEYKHADSLKAFKSELQDRMNAADGCFSNRFYFYFQKIADLLIKWLRHDPISEGNWHGNDTTWRMALDLNSILYYANSTGKMQNYPQRRIFNVVDGIVAGEAEGPLAPNPKRVGILVGGSSAPAVDAVVAKVMGFDYRKIPIILKAFDRGHNFPLVSFYPDEIEVISNLEKWNNLDLLNNRQESLAFEPPSGWREHIEL